MSKLEFPFKDAPAPGETIAIADDLIWIRQQLPFVLDHVNCWYLKAEKQNTLIDTGVQTPTSIAAMQTHLDSLGMPEQLIVTHFHPDHSGLSGWFASQGVKLLSNQIEYDIVRTLWNISDADYGEFYAQWYLRNGITGKPIEQSRQRGNHYKALLSEPARECGYLEAGDTFAVGARTYQIKIGRGHAPQMLMLFDEDQQLLIAADQLLPTISPNVSLMPNITDDDPLNSFIETLHELRKLPADTLILPSHGVPFYGLHDRVDDLLAHHEQRCDQILQACRQPQSASDLFKVLFNRELDAQQMSFALGEALAHARYLRNLGSLTELDDQQIVQFQTTSV